MKKARVTKRLRVAIYGRVSGDKQADEATIETQLSVCEKWCANNNAEIIDYYLDNPCKNSVRVHLRKGGRRLLIDAAAGRFDIVLVYMIDRWARKRQVFYEGLDRLTELSIGFASATQTFETYTPSGRAFLNMLTTFAELDRDMIELKLTDGREKWAKDTYTTPEGAAYNYWSGGRTPYGYRVVEVHRRSGLEVDDFPIEGLEFSPAQVVRWCYEWIVYDRITCAEAARRLNARRAPRCSYLADGSKGRLRSPTGYNYWTPQNVSQLLRNPIYRGEHFFGLQSKKERDLIPRVFPRIVEPRLWEQAQEALHQRRTWSDRNAKHLYLLRGLIKCGACGYNFVATARYGGGKEVPGRHHYLCQSKHDQRRVRRERDGLRCPAKPIRETIEQVVWSDILDFIQRPSEALNALRQQMEGTMGRTDHLQAEIDQEQARLAEKHLAEKRLVRLYTDGRCSDAHYSEVSAELLEEMRAIEERIVVLERLLGDEQRVERRLHTAADWLQQMRQRVEEVGEWTWDARRALVELWVKQIWVDPPAQGDREPTVRIQYLFSDPAAYTTEEDTRPSSVISCIWLERVHRLSRAA